MLRLFVGIELPDDVRARFAELESGVRQARWVAPENLHLSLRFIGDVDDDVAEDVDAALLGVRGRRFALAFNGVGCFESRGRARVLWAGVQPSPELNELQARVEKALIRAGLPPETRKFKAHVTLARFKRAAVENLGPFLERYSGFREPPFEVEHFVLFRSHLGRGGASYEVIADYPLDGAA